MEGEYLRIFTEDGIELQGFLCAPRLCTRKTAVLHIHGTAGNFYENRFIDAIADTFVSKGYTFLTVNTRGHDIAASFIQRTNDGLQSVEIGAAYERILDCVKDISAWVTVLAERGYSHIVLEGHSLGTIKVVLYCSEKSDVRIKGLILMSPTDSVGWHQQRLGNRFPLALQLAQQMVEEGRGSDLMPRDFFLYPVSATTYVDRYGPETKRAVFNFTKSYRDSFEELAHIRVPMLAFLGTENEAIVGEPQVFLARLQEVATACPSCTIKVIPGALHNYLGHEKKVAHLIVTWLDDHFE